MKGHAITAKGRTVALEIVPADPTVLLKGLNSRMEERLSKLTQVPPLMLYATSCIGPNVGVTCISCFASRNRFPLQEGESPREIRAICGREGGQEDVCSGGGRRAIPCQDGMPRVLLGWYSLSLWGASGSHSPSLTYSLLSPVAPKLFSAAAHTQPEAGAPPPPPLLPPRLLLAEVFWESLGQCF